MFDLGASDRILSANWPKSTHRHLFVGLGKCRAANRQGCGQYPSKFPEQVHASGAVEPNGVPADQRHAATTHPVNSGKKLALAGKLPGHRRGEDRSVSPHVRAGMALLVCTDDSPCTNPPPMPGLHAATRIAHRPVCPSCGSSRLSACPSWCSRTSTATVSIGPHRGP